MAIRPLPHRVEMPSADGMPYQFEGIQQNFDALLQNDQALQDQIDDLGDVESGITALTGDVTASGTGSVAATIADDAVTTVKIADEAVTAAKIEDGVVSNAKLADMAQATIKGRAAAAGSGVPTDLTANQVSTILDDATDPFLRTSAYEPGEAGYYSPLTNGDPDSPELVFADGDVIMVWTP